MWMLCIFGYSCVTIKCLITLLWLCIMCVHCIGWTDHHANIFTSYNLGDILGTMIHDKLSLLDELNSIIYVSGLKEVWNLYTAVYIYCIGGIVRSLLILWI